MGVQFFFCKTESSASGGRDWHCDGTCCYRNSQKLSVSSVRLRSLSVTSLQPLHAKIWTLSTSSHLLCRLLSPPKHLLASFGPRVCDPINDLPEPAPPPSLLGHKGHRPGQDMGLMQRPWNSTRLAGQWQPATQGLWHGPISFQLSQVLVQPGPQVSYTAPCLHWVAGGRVKKKGEGYKISQ